MHNRWMRFPALVLPRFIVYLLACVVALTMAIGAPGVALAQSPPATAEPAVLLEAARKDLETVRAGQAQSEVMDDVRVQELRKLASSVKTRADDAAAALAPELTAVQERLAELGTSADGVKESPDVAAQRADLQHTQSTLDSQIKLARLMAVEAEQATATASALRRSQFSARLEARTPAVLGPQFWRAVAADLPADLRRLEKLRDDLKRSAATAPWGAWLVAAAVIVALLLARVGVQRLVVRFTATRVPSGRLRRSLHAVGVLMIGLLTPGLIAYVVVVALESGGGVSPQLSQLLGALEALVWFGGFVVGLGAALLMADKPSWRLSPVSDETAQRLRWFPLALAVVIGLGAVLSRLLAIVDAGLATTWALNGLSALGHWLVLVVALVQLQRLHREGRPAAHAPQRGESSAEAASRMAVPLWLPTLRVVVWVALIASVLALLAGYIALGSFVIGQVVWGLVVVSAAYLLAVLVDDLFMTLLAPTVQPLKATDKLVPDDGQTAPPAPKTREQAAVLLSGLSRILVGLFALLLLVAPYGEGPLELFNRASRVNEGLSIGEISVKPGALLQAVLVLVIGLFVVGLLKDWLAKRYMPTTRMDMGMRLSVTTLIGYVGAVVVISMAMSAAGVGLERVAWVASALSVGIGFGLQAVVQNFVSGLILLAERPVKVGDWVSLGGVEGDIRRINVRATEIQMGDRSTVIVPNSEFITKIVRNVTYTDPLGMVQIKLPMPLATDTRKARDVLLEAFRAHPGVLTTPAPNVQLDGIDGGNLVFNATGFVSSPRASYGVRSDLLFDVLERLRVAELSLGKPPTVMVQTSPPAEA